MLSFLPAPLLCCLNLLLISVNTLICSIPIFILSLLRPLLPFKAGQNLCEQGNNVIYHLWMDINGLIMRLTNRINYRISGLDQIKVKRSCIVVSNHLSWADIVMLCHIFGHRIPITKFFLKHSLIYIPVIGLVCWGVGMPFLRRYSKKELLKNPKLKNKDIESTRKACRRLVCAPSTLVNFAEGTRFTPAKKQAVNSPYAHLMPPKAASLAIALGQIGSQIECFINLTLAYPKNPEKPFIALLKGRMHEVYAHIEVIPKDQLPIGDYLKDKEFKHSFTLWLRDLWAAKDTLLTREVYGPAEPAALQPPASADAPAPLPPLKTADQQKCAADPQNAETQPAAAEKSAPADTADTKSQEQKAD